MKKIAVIVAMDKELALIKEMLTGLQEQIMGASLCYLGNAGGNEICLSKCGIGKVNSACGALEVIRGFQPDAVINTGIAGGLDPSLKIGDMVAGADLAYHDVWCGEGNCYGQVQGLPPVFHSDTQLLEKAMACGQSEKIRKGLICGGDKFISDKTELAAIKKAFPEAMAVDMESCSIAQVCYLYEVPFLSLRLVSDTPGVDNHQQQYAAFWADAPQNSAAFLERLLTVI